MANETGNKVDLEHEAENVMVVLCYRLKSELPAVKFGDLLKIRHMPGEGSGSGLMGDSRSRYYERSVSRKIDDCKVKLDIHVDQKKDDGSSHLVVEIRHPSFGRLPVYYAISWKGNNMPENDVAYFPVFSSEYFLFFEGEWLSEDWSSTKMVTSARDPKEIAKAWKILDGLCENGLETPEMIELQKLLDLRFAFLSGLWRSEQWDFVSRHVSYGDCRFYFATHIYAPSNSLIVKLEITKANTTVAWTSKYPKWSDVPYKNVLPYGVKNITKEVDALGGMSFGLITKTVKTKTLWENNLYDGAWVNEDDSGYAGLHEFYDSSFHSDLVRY
jgi:hypothetical protein